ncbi:MAG: ComF family protein [Firmicutes bacterium]|nr:ComF family protein [Bacillota bacterium]
MNKTGKTLGYWPEAFLRLFYPPRCLICRAILPATALPGPPCCPRCRAKVPMAGPYCPRCGSFHPGAKDCCPGNSPLRSLFALSFYRGEFRKMLHRLKYRGGRHLARPLGEWLGMALLEVGWTPDLVTYIPLHPRKLTRRGYNQAELVARRVAVLLKVPLVPALKKVKDNPSQTGLSRRERHRNVAGTFASLEVIPPGNSLLLVDDIYTTGATMKEAAAVLSRPGMKIYGAVAAFQSFN